MVTRPRDLPAFRGIRIAPNRVVFVHWDQPDFEPRMTPEDLAALKADVEALLGEEIARELAAGEVVA